MSPSPQHGTPAGDATIAIQKLAWNPRLSIWD
jgi:hypothetical protein